MSVVMPPLPGAPGGAARTRTALKVGVGRKELDGGGSPWIAPTLVTVNERGRGGPVYVQVTAC